MPKPKTNKHNKRKHAKRKNKSSHSKVGKEQAIKQAILAFMKAHPSKMFSSKEVRTQIELWQGISINKLKKFMDELTERGRLEYLDKGKYRYLSQQKTLVGEIQVTRSGVGFLLQDEGDDIFIGSSSMGKALNGDMVEVRLTRRRRKGGRQEGEVTKIIQRSQTQFVGVVEAATTGAYFFLPDDPKIKTDFYIPKKHLNDAKHGEKVLVGLLNWDRLSPEVEVLQILGKSGEHDTEMHAILLQYGFNPNFPAKVEQEAANISEKIPAKERKARRDMSDVPTFTIDPSDAKDFDDALSFRILENGHYEIGVHIADVSYYVKPGSELDKEAFQRATSVYLVDRTVPMLPEKLSNRLCSLRPQEEKLTYSAIFEMDENAKVHKHWIGRTVIFSDHRFDYDGAQAVLDGTSEGPFAEELKTLNDLAQKLRKQRMGKGSIGFESNEVKFVLDEDDKPVAVVKKIMKDSNHLIEDFMLLANRTVAAHLYKLKKNPPLPSIYRIHDLPNPEKLQGLQQFVQHFGYKVDFEQDGNPSEQLNQLLQKVHGSAEQNVIETIAIRSMSKAIYSTHNIGHFGLGFQFYSHFTSPIRRYPDLMLHRLVTNYQKEIYQENPVVLEAQAKHCSNRERTAAEAERASIKYKQVEFLQDKIGEEFSGIISGVIESGFFVELDDNLCEGFVPARTLEDDYYAYDEANYALVGKASGNVLRLGDAIRVEISGTDLKRRTIDMVWLGRAIHPA
ncbi:MAG: ribonuclease R [Bacteroidota bacterium]